MTHSPFAGLGISAALATGRAAGLGVAPRGNHIVTQQFNGFPRGALLCAYVQSSGLSTSGGVAEQQWTTVQNQAPAYLVAPHKTAALRRTGGKLATGQASNPAVIVKFTGPGYGNIHASFSGGGVDTNPANNGTALGVRVL